MAGTFPTLSDGQCVKAGYTHKLQIRANVQQFRSGVEQRYATSGLLNSIELPYTVRWTDAVALRNFFIAQKGAFDSSWSISLLDPSTRSVRSYAGMAFDSDEFTVTESQRGRYSISLSAVQTVAEPVPVVPGAAFPILSTGARVQIPATAKAKYRTDRNDLDWGKRIAYYAWGDPLQSWPLQYGLISDVELQSTVNHYLANGGPVNAFSFTDPDTLVSYATRYSTDPLVITRSGKNRNALTLTLQQVRESIPTVVVVDGRCMPWLSNAGLNTAYPYGQQDGQPPVVVPVSAGQSVTIRYIAGSIAYGIGTAPDADGDPGSTGTGNFAGAFPKLYMLGSGLGQTGLCGAFAYDSGEIIQLVSIGKHATLMVPADATRLQLGINDNQFSDNVGSFTLLIS